MTSQISKLQDDDMQAAPTALMRAGVQARELAQKTGTAVVIVRNGILVEERVDDSSQLTVDWGSDQQSKTLDQQSILRKLLCQGDRR